MRFYFSVEGDGNPPIQDEAASTVTAKHVSKRDLRKVIKREIAVFEDRSSMQYATLYLLSNQQTLILREHFRMLELYALKCAVN
ncbi:hypothetical protein Bhyg_10822 [Pseudolycoriella hygida]|uniref:Uncharacterized protein n=1 Tax=Pseudolycoriella hygida TaxID=35572 RepID=A0A9Q0MVH0_9DIPT|nr:hypothetical protein Bhyg_10822 [Pseudolycoriella hygida]